MTAAFFPYPAKGGTAKTRSIIFDPNRETREEYRAVRRAARLHGLEENTRVYERVVGEMTARYGLGLDTILSLGEAAGTCSGALALLDSGMPVEYILAMGGAPWTGRNQT